MDEQQQFQAFGALVHHAAVSELPDGLRCSIVSTATKEGQALPNVLCSAALILAIRVSLSPQFSSARLYSLVFWLVCPDQQILQNTSASNAQLGALNRFLIGLHSTTTHCRPQVSSLLHSSCAGCRSSCHGWIVWHPRQEGLEPRSGWQKPYGN